MIKVDIFSGFLGAGKTTLIKKLLEEAYKGEKLVLIENEFGDVGIDGSLFREGEVTVNEINGGCVCCSLAGDFANAFAKVVEQYHPDRVLIEPSGVGKLSDIASAVQEFDNDEVVLNTMTTVVDAKKCKMYSRNFGEFFENQVEYAMAVVLSHTDGISDKKLQECIDIVRKRNPEAVLITTPWDELTGEQMLDAIECKDTVEIDLEKMMEEYHEHKAMHAHEHEHEHEHHHHDHDHDDHEHHHHHDHDHGHEDHDHEEHEHHHHDHDHEEHDHDEHKHHHHHDHDEHDHDHEHHHHHHAEDIFTSWGRETTKKYTKEELDHILRELEHQAEYGLVIRSKGIVENADGGWIHFEYTPGEPEIKEGSAGIIGRLCVIGADIDEEAIAELFGVE